MVFVDFFFGSDVFTLSLSKTIEFEVLVSFAFEFFRLLLVPSSSFVASSELDFVFFLWTGSDESGRTTCFNAAFF